MKTDLERRTIKNIRGKLITQYKKSCQGCGINFWASRTNTKYCNNFCGRDNRDYTEVYFREKATRTKHNAKSRDIQYDLTWLDLKKVYDNQRGLCYYTKLPLNLIFASKPERRTTFDQLSIDRIDSNKGYTLDNIVLCCLAINMMKNEFDLKELTIMLEAVCENFIKDRKVEIKIKKMDDSVIIPKYQRVGDSGFDLAANESATIAPGETKLISTGLKFQIPEGYEMQVRPRSGMSVKTKFRVANSPGTIDSNYLGEVKIIAENIGHRPIFIEKGDRIAQGVICPVYEAKFVEEEFTETNRGEAGFGSSGVKSKE